MFLDLHMSRVCGTFFRRARCLLLFHICRVCGMFFRVRARCFTCLGCMTVCVVFFRRRAKCFLLLHMTRVYVRVAFFFSVEGPDAFC